MTYLRPWEKVAVDLFTLNQKYYLVTVDYYSGYWELDRVHNTDSGTVVRKLKAHFARHGSACQLVSDNGPQFVAAEFQKLTKGTLSTGSPLLTIVRLTAK